MTSVPEEAMSKEMKVTSQFFWQTFIPKLTLKNIKRTWIILIFNHWSNILNDWSKVSLKYSFSHTVKMSIF